MKEGLLWYDDDRTTTTEQKVARAAAAYRVKFGRTPNVCYVNSSVVGVEQVGPVKVRTLSNVLIHHYWIGEQGETDANKD